MHDFPKTISTRQDVYNLLPVYPAETKGFVTRLLDEHKSWQNGQYLPDPMAGLYRLGMTVDECLAIAGDYLEPPVPPQPPTPEEQREAELAAWRNSTSCGPLQFRRALRALGLMQVIKEYMQTAPEEVQEAWEYASVFNRMDPLVVAMQTEMAKTDDEVDALFRLALTYQ